MCLLHYQPTFFFALCWRKGNKTWKQQQKKSMLHKMLILTELQQVYKQFSVVSGQFVSLLGVHFKGPDPLGDSLMIHIPCT